jgi:uncharacterized protein (DUF305 family)
VSDKHTDAKATKPKAPPAPELSDDDVAFLHKLHAHHGKGGTLAAAVLKQKDGDPRVASLARAVESAAAQEAQAAAALLEEAGEKVETPKAH